MRHVDNSSSPSQFEDKQLEFTGWLPWHTSPPKTPQQNSPWPRSLLERASFLAGEDGKREAEDGTMQRSLVGKAAQQSSKRPARGGHIMRPRAHLSTCRLDMDGALLHSCAFAHQRDDGDGEPARAEQIHGPGSWQLE